MIGFCDLLGAVWSGIVDGMIEEFVSQQAPAVLARSATTYAREQNVSALRCQGFLSHCQGLVYVGVGVGQRDESGFKLGGSQVHSSL